MNPRQVELDQRVDVRADVGYRCLGDQSYVYSLATGETLQLSGVGALIWQGLLDGQMLPEIVTRLSAQFSVPFLRIQQDTQNFVQGLYDHGLVRLNGRAVEFRRTPEAMKRWQPDAIPAEVKRQRIPFRIDFETTYACNLDCAYCYTPKDRRPLLTTRQVQSILEQLAAAGTLFLCFTGGEPCARRDLDELLLYAQAQRFALMVLSNATQITRARAALFAQTSIVQVSLHGARPETHDAFTGQPGSFKRACRGIQYLAEAGANAYVIFNTTNHNIREEDAVRRLCEEWQIGFHLNVHLLPNVGTGSLDALQYRISDDAVQDLVRQGKLMRTRSSCTAATTKARISPFGDIYACELLRQSFGNLRTQPFAQVWPGADVEAFRASKFFTVPKLCQTCAWSKYCRRCPALAELEDRNADGPSSEACRVARLIAEVQCEADTPVGALAPLA